MVTGGNESNSVLRSGPCRLRQTEPAYQTGPGCDVRPIYGIAMPGRPVSDDDTVDDDKPERDKKRRFTLKCFQLNKLTGYVFCNGEDRVPIPNDSRDLDKPDNYRSIFTAVDGDTMKVAWQIIVDGNLDNTDADYQGKYAFSTCYNSEGATNLAGMMANEQDWVVIFNLKRIEEAVKKGDFKEMNGVPVIDGRKGSAYTRYVPVSNNPHGLNTAPDGIHIVAAGKLSPTVTVGESFPAATMWMPSGAVFMPCGLLATGT
jgi:hypothetical protein